MDQLIKKDIENDLESCIACLFNARVLMNNLNLLNERFPEEAYIKNIDFNEIKEKQKKEIITILARACELAFKYLLKIKQIELYPNHSYEQFSKTQVIFNKGSINDLRTKGHISELDASEIFSIKDDVDKQKFHNFTYLSTVVEKLMPETYKNLKKYYELKYCSDNQYGDNYEQYKKYIDSYESYRHIVFFKSILFPSYLTKSIFHDTKALNSFTEKMQKVEKESGDAFTKLRYFSNNIQGKDYNLLEIFEYTDILISFVMGIRSKNDDLLANPEMLFARKMACRYAKEIERSEEEINKIFDKYDKDDRDLFTCRLFSNYTFSEMEEIDKKCHENDIEVSDIYEYDLTIDECLFFKSVGWLNPFMMMVFVKKTDGTRRNLDEVSKLVEDYHKLNLDDELANIFYAFGVYLPDDIRPYLYDQLGNRRSRDDIEKLLQANIIKMAREAIAREEKFFSSLTSK